MTIVVLLVLAVIWGAVLVPPMLRARAESRPADSIGNFRHQLSVLRRAAPTTVSPASPLRAPGLAASRRAAPVGAGMRYAYHRPGADSRVNARRARTLKRRRDVLFTLMVAMGLTLVLGLLPPFRVLLGLHVVCDLLFAGYVVLLVRARNEAAEREMKLRFLPATAHPDNVLLLRRSAN